MCELMGMSFAKPIAVNFSIREFALRGEENADGWGLAWYPDQSLAIVKEPVKWRASAYTGFLENYTHQSSITIAHVRHGTTGGPPTHADTHPFSRELNGLDYCFAHNGTIVGPFWELPLGRFKPIGRTDSEHVFCHVLEEVAQRGASLATEDDWRWLHGKLRALNRQGRVNCLLSDGKRLFCYHDIQGWKGLHFCNFWIREKGQRLADAQLGVDLEERESVNHGFVVATQPLSSKGWRSFQPGELLVLEDGTARFSSQRTK
ncbi:MAG: class II glutamine amidotransferase [Gemmataceae bacterium]|nr:class II glutamine amidotransferase [Gemmataceae bacterium]